MCLSQISTGVGGGHWGLSETGKPAKISTKTEKQEEKSNENGKPAENYAQNHTFVVFNPSTLDTTAKYWPWGPFNAPVILLVAQIQSHMHYPKGHFCNVQPKQSLFLLPSPHMKAKLL